MRLWARTFAMEIPVQSEFKNMRLALFVKHRIDTEKTVSQLCSTQNERTSETLHWLLIIYKIDWYFKYSIHDQFVGKSERIVKFIIL